MICGRIGAARRCILLSLLTPCRHELVEECCIILLFLRESWILVQACISEQREGVLGRNLLGLCLGTCLVFVDITLLNRIFAVMMLAFGVYVSLSYTMSFPPIIHCMR